MLERLQKILSARGIASRRKAEEYIEQGLVTVNGVVAKIGDKADPQADHIVVDGKVLSDRKEMFYYVMNKPVGIETSNKPTDGSKNTRTVRDLLPERVRDKIFPVGRLDKDSSGLLLFTNDGVLAYRLTHPKFHHEKEYEVTVDRPIPSKALKKIEEGIVIKEGKTKPARAEKIAPEIFRLALTEGKYRQIRRMCQQVGYTVKDLQRVRIMTLEDPNLKPGKLRRLDPEEIAALLSSVGLENQEH